MELSDQLRVFADFLPEENPPLSAEKKAW